MTAAFECLPVAQQFLRHLRNQDFVSVRDQYSQNHSFLPKSASSRGALQNALLPEETLLPGRYYPQHSLIVLTKTKRE
jgi:hypothetical protein